MTQMSKTTDTLPPKSWAEIRDTLEPNGENFAANIPANWRQGRTAYGGLTAALMLEAAERSFEDLPPLRSALINFVGPVTEAPTLTAALERQGRNVTSISAAARIEHKAVGRAKFLFGRPRESKISVDFPAPPTSHPDDCDAFTPEVARDMVPTFFHNFETKLVAGARPMMGDEGYIRTWSRHKDPASRSGIGALLCIGDVLPPAAMPLMRSFAPVSSMSWIFNVLMENPATDDGWWQIEARLTAARGGYSSQVMRIWNTDGQLAVEGMQSIAIFDS